MTTFVLVHGAYHDGTCWDAVATRLGRHGHQVHAPTLPTTGEGSATVTISDLRQSVVSILLEHDLWDVVLVGHSLGAVIVAQVADRVPERLARLVIWSGIVLRDGQRVVDELPTAALRALSRADADGDETFLPLFDEVQDTFFASVDLDHARALYRQYWRPQPMAPLWDTVRLARFPHVDVPMHYLVGSADVRGDRPEHGWHPYFSARLPGAHVSTFSGDHEAMLTAPDALVEALLVCAHG